MSKKKECTKCGVVLPATRTHFDEKTNTYSPGLRAWCKACCRGVSRKEWEATKAKRYEKNSERRAHIIARGFEP